MSREKGNIAEDKAAIFLENRGFTIVKRNFYSKLGEIDIVAKKCDTLHFIEVKSSNKDFNPIYNITPSKLNKIIKTAYYFMKVNNLDLEFSIDAILLHNEDIEFIENITI